MAELHQEDALPNPVVHFQILSNGPNQLHEFYAGLFEWRVDTSNPAGYGFVDTGADKGINGGIGTATDTANLATFYVEVDDIAAKLDEAVERGGEIVTPVTSLPGMVTYAMFSDPEGNRVGLVSSQIPD